MSNILKKIEKKNKKSEIISDDEFLKEYEKGLMDEMSNGYISNITTSYIQRWINKDFNPIYWIENNHGKMEYEEMAILVLTIYKSEIKMFLPLTFENDCYLKAYQKMEDALEKKELKKLNTEFIDTYDIDINVIRKDAVMTLKNYFQASKEKLEGEKNVA